MQLLKWLIHIANFFQIESEKTEIEIACSTLSTLSDLASSSLTFTINSDEVEQESMQETDKSNVSDEIYPCNVAKLSEKVIFPF